MTEEEQEELHISELREKAYDFWLERLEIAKKLDYLPPHNEVVELLFTECCPLCEDLGCRECPIMAETGDSNCRATPYYEIREGDYEFKEELIALIDRMVAIVKGQEA